MQDQIRADTFLQKRSYRRRRLRDGIKLLPFLGAWLFLMPVLWPDADTGTGQMTSRALIYVFGAWAVLTLLSVGFLTLYRRVEDAPVDDNGEA